MLRFSAPIFSRFCLGFICAFLGSAIGCGGGESEDPAPSPEPQSTLIVWTTVDPLDVMARAVEEFFNRYNEKTATHPAALRYIPKENFAQKLSHLGEEDLPPDLFLLSGVETLELAGGEFLRPCEELAKMAGVQRERFFESALRTVEADGHLWALPVCGETTLTYVNLNLPEAPGINETTWEAFLAGKSKSCRVSSDHLMELKRAQVSFRWEIKAPPKENSGKDKKNAFRTLALSASSHNLKSPERFVPLLQDSQTTDTANLFSKIASKLHVWDRGKIPDPAGP